MCNAGNFVEDIAAALNKTVNSVEVRHYLFYVLGQLLRFKSERIFS